MPSGSDRSARARRGLELAFLPAALEIAETPPSPTARATLMLMFGVVASVVLWACIGRIDIITTAQGFVIPAGSTKIVQPFETGVIRAIRVHDGQHVRHGDVLVEIDPTTALAGRDQAKHQLLYAELDRSRLSALIAGDPSLFHPPDGLSGDDVSTAGRLMQAEAARQSAKLADLDHQSAEKQAEIDEVQADMHRLDATMPMLKSHLRIRVEAIRSGAGNELDYYDSLRAVVDQQQQRTVEASKLTQAQQTLVSLQKQRSEAVSDERTSLLNDLSKAEADIAQHSDDLVKADRDNALQTLRAPVDGTAQQLSVHTIGGVVTPAELLLVVVPANARLQVEAHIPNRDVGFVQPGQDVDVKVEALEFTHYGLLHGTVTDVSRDAVPRTAQRQSESTLDESATGTPEQVSDGVEDPDYVAHVTLNQQGLRTEKGFVHIEPGMTITAEIKTGRRRVIDYILSPLKQYQSDAMRER